MNDFNAKLGKERSGECIGSHERNEQKERLNIFLVQY